MATRAKRSRIITRDPDVVASMVLDSAANDNDSDNEGMSSSEESDLDRELVNESEETR